MSNIDTKKKIGLIGCIATGIGAIIGSGIFGSLPTVINDIGPAVILAFVAAVIYIVAQFVPSMYANSIIPASGSFFLWSAKIVHPIVGLFMAIQNLLQPLLVGVFAVLFADYFVVLFPAFESYKVIVSVAILLIYTFIAWFGNYTFVSINNIMVVILLVAIGLYIVIGLPSMNSGQLTLGEVFHPGVKLTSFGAAVGVLSSSLSGGSAISQISGDIKNPRRTVPLAIILSPIIVAVIYILMAIVTLGAMPGGELSTLSEVGEEFLSPSLLTFFIVGGPLFGVLTSMVPVIMLSCSQIQAAVDNGVFPKIIGKKNKHDVSPIILVYVMGLSIISAATGASFGVLMTVFSFVQALAALPPCLVPFFLHKRYPHACNHAGLKMNRPFVYVVSIFSFIYSTYLAISMILSLDVTVWLLIGGAMILSIIYFIFRFRYKKSIGQDLMQELKAPYEEWEKFEAECRTMDEQN